MSGFRIVESAGRRANASASPPGPTPTPRPPADYIITSDAEWDAVMANSAATLAGKIVEIRGSNFTRRTIAGPKDMKAAGAPLTIRSYDAGSRIPSLLLAPGGISNAIRGITFSGLNFQLTGWPKNYPSCIHLNSGIHGAYRFENGTSFRHGYGEDLADIDTAATLPEYARIDHVRTATTTSATYPLTWQNNAATNGNIEFFNRGTQAVYLAIGGPGVVATTSSILCPAGVRTRVTGQNPTTATHFAILAASGTVEVNARAEIGLSYYLGHSITADGAAAMEDVFVIGCKFSNLSNGLNLPQPSLAVIMDNDFDRIYADVIGGGPGNGGAMYVLRNTYSLQFSLSNLADGAVGDASDPHGDWFQTYNSGAFTIGPIFLAGNRPRVGSLRPGVRQQGVFISDNPRNPSYTDIYAVSEILIGGAASSFGIAIASNPSRDTFVHGITIVPHFDRTAASTLFTAADAIGTAYLGSTVVPIVVENLQPVARDKVLVTKELADKASLFPNFAQLAAARSVAEVENALATGGAAAGIGAVATREAVDWTATDHTKVIRWENLPSGVHWNELTFQPLNTMVALPLKRILNKRPAQTVAVGTATEWRKVAADKTTELQGWSTANGTIEPGQYIQLRTMTSATANTATTASVTINGFTQSVSLRTEIIPQSYLVQGSTAGWFRDVPTTIPAGTTKIRSEGLFYFAGSIPAGNTARLFSKADLGFELATQSVGSMLVWVRDSANVANLYAQTVPVGTLVANRWYHIAFEVDHQAQIAAVTINGKTFTSNFQAASTGLFSSHGRMCFLAQWNGSDALPAGTRFADLKVYLNGVLHKALANDAATINADPWKQGGAFTQG